MDMNVNSSPMVSVLMPIYRVEKYLPESIESVLNQTYHNLELILVDDGSPDKCPELVDSYAKRDQRIVAVHQKNSGVDAARNNALDLAKGKYIAFIDSDDAYEPNYLKTLVYYAEKSQSELVSCSFIPFGVDNPPKFKLLPTQECDRDTAVEYLLGYNSFNGYVWNKLFLKSLIQKNHLRFQDGYWACDDVLFAGNYLYYCKRIKILEDALYRYRQVPSGANRVRYSGKVPFQKKWLSPFKVTDHFKELYKSEKVVKACELHEVREAGIALRAMVASKYQGEEYGELRKLVRKKAGAFYRSRGSSTYQKFSIFLTQVSPKLELSVWRLMNKDETE